MADKPDKTIDPYDVEALEKSLNDSATRVSTIWVSFLIFSLYLLTAAATVTHRQLFLAEPVKLPVLNIDLPLWGFFFLAPILFVIFHAYVLMQVILLSRTAHAYNNAVARAAERDKLSAEENASLRQRLANTLFAQIFAGSPREREGTFGRLLRSMAWISLAFAPILILLTFQFMFLPYHSHLATWTHRLLILLEFVLAFQLWPLVLNPQRDFHFQWPDPRRWIRESVRHVRELFRSGQAGRRAWQGLRQRVVPIAASLVFVVVSLSLATFPGEPHVNLATAQSWSAVQCQRWFSESIDRLSVGGLVAIDSEKLARIEKTSSELKLKPHQGARTRDFENRDFTCGQFASADLRRTDLSNARLIGSILAGAVLDGAVLDSAALDRANLHRAQLRGASLRYAELREAELGRADLEDAYLYNADLRGASLERANLQGADLDWSDLQGADLLGARLQGASLRSAKLQGATLQEADMRAASLKDAWLQGAGLSLAQLQGADLEGSHLHGADLLGANLSGANLLRAGLQGADLTGATLTLADLSGARVWRTRASKCADPVGCVDSVCRDARVGNHDSQAKLEIFGFYSSEGTPEGTEKFIAFSLKDMIEAYASAAAARRMREGLRTIKDDETTRISQIWKDCEAATLNVSAGVFDDKLAEFLSELACRADGNRSATAKGIIRNWFSLQSERLSFSVRLARRLNGNGEDCPNARQLDEQTKERIRSAGQSLAPPKMEAVSFPPETR